ncbi:MAG: hypothetical protein WKF58_04750 [Ilumatobacteraceae bacterium]
MRRVPATLDRDELAARHRRQRDARRVGTDGVIVAVDHEHGAASSFAHRREALEPACVETSFRVDQERWFDLEAPADAVLDLLGRVRLGEDPTEEELEESRVVTLPGDRVVAGPTIGLGERSLERVDIALGVTGSQRHRRADAHHAEHSVGMIRRELNSPQLFRDARLGRFHPGNSLLTHELVGKLSLGINPDESPRWG